jgi:hypothetical protein
MTGEQIVSRFTELSAEKLPRPGGGNTADRHGRIFDAGREDLSLAKLVEAHWDAVSILQEAGHVPAPDAKYAVWASEIPGRPMQLVGGRLSGVKEFCSGAGLVDRALVTAGDAIVEVDLTALPDRVSIDGSGWQTEAFRATQTSALTFRDYPATVIGEADWYVQRPGFWQGACGPAAAWAGGAAGLVDYAMRTKKDDPHTTAHLAAMHANVWAMEALLRAAATEFDREPTASPMVRALELRHLIELLCTDTLRRFSRALGPAPLARDADTSRRYAELDLFLRQCHAERDLESLGRALRSS